MQKLKDWTLICDIDGVLTTGEHFYNEKGKVFKSFGSNDKDALCVLLQKFGEVIFCSADYRGGKINSLRTSELGIRFEYIPVLQRQEFVNKHTPCMYIGDGIEEPSATINFCLQDSTPQAMDISDHVLPTFAGKNVFPHLLMWLKNNEIFTFGMNIKRALGEKIVLAGVGKNFSLAQLVSEFFLPYNMVAVPLDANHSTHGSLGIIKSTDVLIASSKSGNTEELVNMMIALKHKLPNFTNTFLITSNTSCVLAKYFNHILVIDSRSENSLHGLSPQRTIEKYLNVYFQILNILNSDSGCSKKDYLLNHQGGSIGKGK